MAGAIIVIDQPSGAGAGSPGVARNDLWQLQQVNLSCASSNTIYQWDLLDVPPGSGATLTGASTSTPNFLPDLIGTYRIQLITNGGGPGNVQILVIRVRYSSVGVLQNRGWAPPAFGEQSGESNYGGNLRGWAEDMEYILSDALAQLAALGTPFAAGGDLTGTSTSQRVAALQGYAVKNTAPTNGQILTWVASDSEWEPVSPATGFIAGGDLSGSSTSQTVAKINGATAPATPLLADVGKVLYVLGAGAYGLEALPSSLPPNGSASGDLGGSYPGPSVVALQGYAIKNSAPMNGQVLTWVTADSEWEPQPPAAGFTAGGDLTGTSTSQTVARINGATAPSTPLIGDVGKFMTVSGAGAYALAAAVAGVAVTTPVVNTGSSAAPNIGLRSRYTPVDASDAHVFTFSDGAAGTPWQDTGAVGGWGPLVVEAGNPLAANTMTLAVGIFGGTCADNGIFYNQTSQPILYGAEGGTTELTPPFTISCWFLQRINTGGNPQVIMGRSIETSLGAGTIFSVALFMSGSTLSAMLTIAGVQKNLSVAASTPLQQNQWHHVGMTWDGTTWNLYWNGNLVGTVAQSGSITWVSNNGWCFLGAFGHGWSGIFETSNGSIQDARFATIVRPASWFSAVYTRGVNLY